MKILCYFQVRIADSCASVRTGLWKRPDAPQCLEASVLQLSGRLSYIIRTLGQATLNSTQSWISDDTIWEGYAKRPNDVATRPNATQCSRIFRVSFTDAERSDSIDHPNTRSSRLDAVLFWEELRYSRKAVAKDCSDLAKWPSKHFSPESEFEQY